MLLSSTLLWHWKSAHTYILCGKKKVPLGKLWLVYSSSVDRIPREAVLKGKGRLHIFQEGNLKDTGEDHPNVLKDEWAGRLTWLSSDLARAQGKKETLRRGRQIRGATRILCGCERRKLEGPKPNWKLSWLLLEKTKRCFYKCISNKRRAEKEPPSFTRWRGKHKDKGWGRGWGTQYEVPLCLSLY